MQDLAVFRGRVRVGGAEAARAGPGDAPLGRGELAAVCGRSGPHLKKRADLQQRAIYRLQLLVGILPPSRIPLSSSFACRRCQGKHVARTQATLRNEAQGAHHIVQGALRATFAQYWQREPRADEALGDLLVTLF